MKCFIFYILLQSVLGPLLQKKNPLFEKLLNDNILTEEFSIQVQVLIRKKNKNKGRTSRTASPVSKW